MPGSTLDHDHETRAALWGRLAEVLEAHLSSLRDKPILPRRTSHEIGELAGRWLEAAPRGPVALLTDVARELDEGMVHPGHPRYFGLFNPAPAVLAVIADALVSGLNPQLATRGHAPWPVAVEERLIAALGARFGWDEREARGAFTSGGGEANTTALLCALVAAFPEVTEHGVRGLPGAPRVYVSAEGHATVARAARVAGLGNVAVRVVPVDARHRMNVAVLRERLAADRAAGDVPFLVVATAGTTAAGAIDPIADIAAEAERERCWLHVDAAWGGLAALVPELRSALAGIERADSITFDAHKALSAPMGTGAFLTRREGVLERTFADVPGYMPREGASDPYARSLQWSRRFLGLRVLLPLAAVGWDGYAESLRRQVDLARRLRAGLAERGWVLVNDTPLPIACFVDRQRRDARFLDAVARATGASGGGWISVPRFADGTRALRACVNNHRSEPRDIDGLLDALDRAREAAA